MLRVNIGAFGFIGHRFLIGQKCSPRRIGTLGYASYSPAVLWVRISCSSTRIRTSSTNHKVAPDRSELTIFCVNPLDLLRDSARTEASLVYPARPFTYVGIEVGRAHCRLR